MTAAPRWLVPAIGAFISLAILSFIFLAGRREGVAAAKPKIEAAVDAGVSTSLSNEGAALAADQSAALARIERAIRSNEHDLDLEAARDVGGQALPPGVVDRLRRSDERLCASAPRLCAGDEGGDAGAGDAAADPDPG